MIKIISTEKNLNAALDVQKIIKSEIISPSIENFCGDEKILFFNNETIIPKDGIVVHNLWPNSNDNLIELLLLLDCLENSGMERVKLLSAYLPFLRQDRQLKEKSSIGSKILSKLLSNTIIDSIITLDVHSKNAANFFGTKLVNVELSDFFVEKIGTIAPIDQQISVVISPDIGSLTRAKPLASLLRIDYIALDKVRIGTSVKISGFPLNRQFETAIIIDDIIDSASTIIACINHIKDNVKTIIVCASHVINPNVLDNIRNIRDGIEIITTNSTNYENEFCNIYPILAERL